MITLPAIKKSWTRRLLFEIFTGRFFINRLRPDIYISLQNTMTLGVKASSRWTYLHQPLPYQTSLKFSLRKKPERRMWIYQKLVGKIINFTLRHGNSNVIVQTKWMKAAIVNRKIVADSKAFVLPPTNIAHNISIINKQPKSNDFFYPATGMPYKNHARLFEAVEKLEQKGINLNLTCTLSTDDVRSLNLKVPKSVKLVGMLPRNEILKMYGEKILVFPSLLETFGLPLLEARMANDYILAGETSFGCEILADYPNVKYFDPQNVTSIEKRIKECVENGVKIKPEKRLIKDKESLTTLILG